MNKIKQNILLSPLIVKIKYPDKTNLREKRNLAQIQVTVHHGKEVRGAEVCQCWPHHIHRQEQTAMKQCMQICCCSAASYICGSGSHARE